MRISKATSSLLISFLIGKPVKQFKNSDLPDLPAKWLDKEIINDPYYKEYTEIRERPPAVAEVSARSFIEENSSFRFYPYSYYSNFQDATPLERKVNI